VNGANGGKWDSPQFASNKKIMKILKVLFAVGFLAVSLISCGGDKPSADDPLAGFKANKAELGEDWQQFRHDASQNVWVFKDEDGYKERPQMHQKPNGARIFWNGEVTDEEHNLVNEGLSTMLSLCRRDQKNWHDARTGKWIGNMWAKFAYFQKVPDYKVMFVKSNYTVQEGEAAGCAGIITGAHGDCGKGEGTCSAAETVAGLIDKYDDRMPASKGGIYILLAKQSPEQLANPACKSFVKTAVRNGGMHVFFTNETGLYFAHANDGATPDHEYCTGMQ
jgi:hypothetical protein